MKKESYEQLEKRLTRELTAIRLKVEKAKIRRELPKLRSQFVGKYWKYDNGIDNATRWPVYSYCRGIKGGSLAGFERLILDKFETDYRGECSFVPDTAQNQFYCQTEITKEEYLEALAVFKKKLQLMRPTP